MRVIKREILIGKDITRIAENAIERSKAFVQEKKMNEEIKGDTYPWYLRRCSNYACVKSQFS